MFQIRLLFITDSQAKAKNPSRRLDNFPLTMLMKFNELSNVVPAAKIDYVVHGGDFFDLPRVAPEYCGRLAEIIKFSGVPWYVVPGNHDTYGYTVNTIDQTMLGLLAKTNVINLLTRKLPAVLTDYAAGFSVSLQGQEYYAGIDQGNPEDYDVELDSSCSYHVLAAHGMLLNKPFHDKVNQTQIVDINSKADLILAGHYHPGYDPVKQGKTTIINPGAMARVEAGAGDDRMPQYVVIEFDKNGIKFKQFPFMTAKIPQDILDFAGKKEDKIADALMGQFKATLKNTGTFKTAVDVPTALSIVAADPNNGIDPLLIPQALAAVALVQQSADDAIPKLDGFVQSPTRVWIQKVEGENFQSHAKLEMEFVDGLNIIRGESNSGKTAVLRLIKWVLFNEPKGSDMVSNWASSCWGRVHLSNGYIIERKRTKTSGGEYILTDPFGAVQSFKGFGNDIPPEIINAHQMPPIFITKDEKRNIAFATQLETSFLVTDTASFRAAAIGRLTGVHHVDATIRTLNGENRSLSKEITVKEKLVKADAAKLTAFDTLPAEQAVLNQFQLMIDSVQQGEDEINALTALRLKIQYADSTLSNIEQSIQGYNNMPTQAEVDEAEVEYKLLEELVLLRTRIQSADSSLMNIEAAIVEYKDLPTQSEVNEIETEYKLLEDLIRLKATITKADAELAVIAKREAEIKPILAMGTMIQEAEDALKLSEDLTTYKNKIETLDYDLITVTDKLKKINVFIDGWNLLSKDAEDAMADLTYLTTMKANIQAFDTDMMSIGYQMDGVDDRIAKIEEDMILFLGNGICECPTCGTIVDKETLLGGTHHVSV